MKLGLTNDPGFSFKDMFKAVLFLLDTKKKQYLLYTTILISVSFYTLVPTFIVGKIVDFFTQYKSGDSLALFFSYVGFLVVTNFLVAFVRLDTKKRLTNIKSETVYLTKVRGFERLLDFSVKWHDSENTGNKVQRIQNGIDSLGTLQEVLSNGIFPTGASMIGATIAFLFIKPLFFFYCLAYLAIFISVQMSFYSRMVRMNYEYNSLLESASGSYYEGLSNILTIKTLGAKGDFKKNIMSKEELSRDYQFRMTDLGNSKWKSFQFINALAIGGMLILSGKGFLAGTVSLGSIFIIFNYFKKLTDSAGESTNLLEKLISVKAGFSRMMPIFYDNSERKQGALAFPKKWDTCSIQHATFRYPKRSGAEEGMHNSGLEDISITISKYEKIGVVGKSGSGKSTFAKLFLGLYDYDKGEFKIGDTPFQKIKHSEITQEVALVLQDSEMFNLSLKENITLMREFDEVLFNTALQISQLSELVQQLPDGIQTLIGEKGYRLSGGERQRIGIARAIYKDPQILVLDEATSSLDSKTESLIQEGFETHLKKKTIISIAHRISTLKNVDKIVVFDKGTIVEEGGFNELSKKKDSKFYEIYQYQKKHTKV
jgi:ABC-type multidrug transport system fused ATPase/permease subunit